METPTMKQEAIRDTAAGISAWAAWHFSSWSDVASFLAAVYTGLLIAWFFWRRLIRPLLVRHGGLPPPDAPDSTAHGDLP